MHHISPVELQLAADAFNAKAPVGTKVRIFKGRIGENPIDTVVEEPGAFVLGGHSIVVKVAGDSVRVTHVEIVA